MSGLVMLDLSFVGRDPKLPLGHMPGSNGATAFAAEMLGAFTPLLAGDAIVFASQSASGQP